MESGTSERQSAAYMPKPYVRIGATLADPACLYLSAIDAKRQEGSIAKPTGC